MPMALVVALGNPGREYSYSRHNFAWQLIDTFAERLQLKWESRRAQESHITLYAPDQAQRFLFIKPQTYMNESGRAVQSVASFYKIPPQSTVVIYDDLTIDLGKVKVSCAGSAGGHNGVQSIIDHSGQHFIRFRLGIGPKEPPEITLTDFVLGNFSTAQQAIISQQTDYYLKGLQFLLFNGAEQAMNQLNRRN